MEQANRKGNMAAEGNKTARFRPEARLVLADILLDQAAVTAAQYVFYRFLVIRSLRQAEWTALTLDRREWG